MLREIRLGDGVVQSGPDPSWLQVDLVDLAQVLDLLSLELRIWPLLHHRMVLKKGRNHGKALMTIQAYSLPTLVVLALLAMV